MGNKQPIRLVAIDNRTPLYFTWYDHGLHHSRINPGRTWTRQRSSNEGIEVPEWNKDEPTKHAYRFQIIQSPFVAKANIVPTQEFFLCHEGGMLKYWTGKNAPVTVASGVNNDAGLQLTITGSTFEELRFSLQNNNFPTWEERVCVAGFMNSTRFNASISIKNVGGGTERLLRVKDHDYADLSQWKRQEADAYHEGVEIPKSAGVQAHWPKDAHISVQTYDDHSRVVKEWAIRTSGMSIEHYSHDPAHVHNVGWTNLELIPGGRSQLDSPMKYLELVETEEGAPYLKMVERPSDLTPLLLDGHCLGPHANLLVSMDTDLLQNIKLQEHDSTTHFNSFVSRIKLTDRHRNAFADMDICVTSTPPIAVTLNGQEVMLNDAMKMFQTDSEGVITITQPVDKILGAVIFHLGMNKVEIAPHHISIDIHAGDKIASRMQHLKSITDWKEAKDKKGGYIFKDRDAVSEENIAVFKSVILMTSGPRPWNRVDTPHRDFDPNDPVISSSAVGGGHGKALNAASAEASGIGAASAGVAGPPLAIPLVPLYRPHLAHLPKDYAVMIDFKTKTVKSGSEAKTEIEKARKNAQAASALNGVATASASASASSDGGSFWDKLVAWAKDAWDSLVHMAFEVVGEILNVVINGLTYVVSCVSEAFAALGAAIGKLFEAAFDGFVEWLGEIFDWEAIGQTYTMVRSVAENSFAALEYGIDYATSFLKGKLNLQEAKAKAQAVKNVAGVNDSSAGATVDKPPKSDDPSVSAVSDASKSPTFNWAADQAKSADASDGSNEVLPPADDMQELENAISKISDFSAIANTFSDLSDHWREMTFMQIVERVLDGIGEAILNFTDALLDLLKILVKVAVKLLKNIASTTFNVPILSTLWRKHIAKSATAQPTFLDMSCFMIAIPTTYVGKLVSYALGVENPFEYLSFTYPKLEPRQETHVMDATGEMVGPSAIAAAAGVASVATASASASRGYPASTGTAASGTDPLLQAQFGLSLLNCTCQTFAWICYMGLEAEKTYPKFRSPSLKTKLTGVKLFFDLIGTSASIASGSISFQILKQSRAGAEAKKLTAVRKDLAMTLICLQVVLRVKDSLKLHMARKLLGTTTKIPMTIGSRTFDTLDGLQLAGIESVVGIISFGLWFPFIFAYDAEIKNLTREEVPMFRAIMGTKLSQVVITAFYQMLSYPRDWVDVKRKKTTPEPPPMTPDIALMATRIGLSGTAIICNVASTACFIVSHNGDHASI